LVKRKMSERPFRVSRGVGDHCHVVLGQNCEILKDL